MDTFERHPSFTFNLVPMAHADGRGSMALPIVFALVCMAATLVACEKPAPLAEEIPSRVLIGPGPEYRVALDSARAVARRAILRMHVQGVSVAVGRDGDIIWSEGFGWSDLTLKTLATPLTVYPAGSISKSIYTSTTRRYGQ